MEDRCDVVSLLGVCQQIGRRVVDDLVLVHSSTEGVEVVEARAD